ncbi:electron transport complex subunit RsxC [Cognatazoarcus halotolerans]|uniref:electron transport complex subunit RsxC n=1 Tax=Cognatazoarcus halotolerans TaxID=2686016 RepID=UPI001356D13E|nr:electron transport complex subunit RsxC [Cognatazoarcus halotolerans]MBX3679775.1 electron transport complex subunit RsxC [Rhodocyclaceae bacterium]MCB1900675.1 electron transport complex subunit RsxC [Rhodocyclaceae bacterium]MCP5309478.1 electron transport complex subunit RsxC [Zoogloeaceae bacterium]
MLRKLFKFHGGVKPATHKDAATASPIVTPPLPARLKVPLHQSIGGTPRPLVKAGDKVLKGQRIGGADGNVSSAVHAPTSGTVLAVEPVVTAHASGLSTLSVIIEPDGEERWIERQPIDLRATPADEIRDYLRDQGVVGLGGAVFPSHLKLKASREKPTRTLVINGAECEPFITCDDMLMRERAAGIVSGIRVMRQILGAEEVIVGIEDNKPAAVDAMTLAVQTAGLDQVSVVAIPTRYPAGGAKQLIRVLTGIEVPHGARSTDYGVQCFNVGTAYAIHEALELDQPLISRIVTVAGNVGQPRNYEVLFGTPMNELVALAGELPGTDAYIMGGPMMGFRMPAFDVPVVKATNCVLVSSPSLFPPPPPEMNCIRCGECAKACPADLQPFELYWFSRAKNFGKAQEYHLFDCIECGCCSYVCPSHIRLVDYYRFAKSEIWARERDKDAADAARERFDFRNLRQEREKQEKAARLAAKAAETRAKLAGESGDDDKTTSSAKPSQAEEAKKALIAAALEKARQQKERAPVPPRNTDNLSADKQAEIDAIEARRAAARQEAE